MNRKSSFAAVVFAPLLIVSAAQSAWAADPCVGVWAMTLKLNEEGVDWPATWQLFDDGTLSIDRFDVENPTPRTGAWARGNLNIVFFEPQSQYVFDGLLNVTCTSVFGSISQGTVGTFFGDRIVFAFVDQTGVEPNTLVDSNITTISGIHPDTPIALTSCTSTSCEYKVNDGDWTSEDTKVNGGDTVQIRQTSSASLGTTTDATLTIGGAADTFSVTTRIGADGESCTADVGCANGLCAGGHCCAGACVHDDPVCGGGCDASGACSYPTAAASCGTCKVCDGAGACLGTPTDDDACGTIACSSLTTVCLAYADLVENRCLSFGLCKSVPGDCGTGAPEPATKSCADSICQEGTLTTHACDGQGTCGTTTSACAPYVCADAASCFTSCSGDAACAVGSCNTVTSSCRDALGDACGDDDQCASGYCADGVCCDSACAGPCERCGVGGYCAPIALGEDPDEECMGTGTCGGTCNGAGACQFPSGDTLCDLCEACDGAGECGAEPADDPACGTIACSALSTACRTYADMTLNRCTAVGTCATPDVLECTEYTDVKDGTACTCSDGASRVCHAGLCVCGQSDGANGTPESSDCRATPGGASTLGLLLFGLLALLVRRARGRTDGGE